MEDKNAIRREQLVKKMEELYKQSKSKSEFRERLNAFIKEHNATCAPEDWIGSWGR
jgi:hypothetical protein